MKRWVGVKRWKGEKARRWKGEKVRRWKGEKVRRWKGEKVKRWEGERWKVNGEKEKGAILGVAEKGRGKGLGDRLVKHAINYAKENGCSHAHACTTGKFSQAIFKKNGFDVYFEKSYEDWKDKDGNVIIQHDIHKVCQINVLKLWFKSTYILWKSSKC